MLLSCLALTDVDRVGVEALRDAHGGDLGDTVDEQGDGLFWSDVFSSACFLCIYSKIGKEEVPLIMLLIATQGLIQALDFHRLDF